ncbi:DUF3800 domain-containing protein [Paraburkholderia phosphatilytica]|uniref:DUF3800 domain-containing protein n=1 Tax=Paraburkholderia phosphatilytica TaxID=2282883 RepID=UPI000E51C1D6
MRLRGGNLHLCYIDESGCLGAIRHDSDTGPTPVFVMAGLFLHKDKINTLTGAVRCRPPVKTTATTHPAQHG